MLKATIWRAAIGKVRSQKRGRGRPRAFCYKGSTHTHTHTLSLSPCRSWSCLQRGGRTRGTEGKREGGRGEEGRGQAIGLCARVLSMGSGATLLPLHFQMPPSLSLPKHSPTHSGLGYLSPNNFERKLNEKNKIAINCNPLSQVETHSTP